MQAARLLACIVSTIVVTCDYSGNAVFNNTLPTTLPFLTSLNQNSLMVFQVDLSSPLQPMLVVKGDTFFAGGIAIVLVSSSSSIIPKQASFRIIQTDAFQLGSFSSALVGWGDSPYAYRLTYDKNGVILEIYEPITQSTLSGGAIAGIVLGCLAGVAAITIIAYFILVRKASSERNLNQDNITATKEKYNEQQHEKKPMDEQSSHDFQ